MKKLKFFFGIAGVLFSGIISAQDLSSHEQITFPDSLSCAIAQEKVLERCNYLFNNPNSEDLSRINAMKFIIDWMSTTPSYVFGFDDDFYKVVKSDVYLSGLYVASLAKTGIEKGYYKNDVSLQFEAITAFLNYIELPQNNVKITKKLQKYIDAKNSGALKGLIVIE